MEQLESKTEWITFECVLCARLWASRRKGLEGRGNAVEHKSSEWTNENGQLAWPSAIKKIEGKQSLLSCGIHDTLNTVERCSGNE